MNEAKTRYTERAAIEERETLRALMSLVVLAERQASKLESLRTPAHLLGQHRVLYTSEQDPAQNLPDREGEAV
jgi:hypothetical protein